MQDSAFIQGSANGRNRPGGFDRSMETARVVQSRLLSSHAARLMTLECAGVTIAAQGVGGDYYDFIKPSPRRLAIALGDVSGKGVPAALMLAALQASLRSHYALGAGDLAKRLESVNRLFNECTASGHFATMFLCEYDERTRGLRYANCGHVPPLLLRADGSLERLGPTATVLGAFAEWRCAVAETTLAPGDTLLMFTDGATEARNGAGEEFGDRRLERLLHSMRQLPLKALLRICIRQVRAFAGGRPSDDLTFVAARTRLPAAAGCMRVRGVRHEAGPAARGGIHADLHPSR